MSWNQTTSVTADVRDTRVSAFLARVYGWMFLGLLITAVTAFAVASSPVIIETIFETPLLLIGLFVAQVGMVFWLSARVAKLSGITAATLFLVYSATVGVTTSLALLTYTGATVVSTFLITASMFGALAVFGTVTRRSLAGVGQFMIMGLIGLLIATVVGIFWQNDILQFVISVVGVIVFTGLTAWDAQRLKHLAVALPDGQVGSYAVVGALSLYLDFINLFFFLLRLLGGRRS